jgi:hypothetical protein
MVSWRIAKPHPRSDFIVVDIVRMTEPLYLSDEGSMIPRALLQSAQLTLLRVRLTSRSTSSARKTDRRGRLSELIAWLSVAKIGFHEPWVRAMWRRIRVRLFGCLQRIRCTDISVVQKPPMFSTVRLGKGRSSMTMGKKVW